MLGGEMRESRSLCGKEGSGKQLGPVVQRLVQATVMLNRIFFPTDTVHQWEGNLCDVVRVRAATVRRKKEY